MTNKTKVISTALSAALAASSFAAFAVTASAADEEVKTFDAVRVTYDSATTEDATLIVNGTGYLVPAGTTSKVITVDENTPTENVKVDITGTTKPEIELVEYEKLTWNTTATAPYLANTYIGGDAATTAAYGNIVTNSGRYAAAFDGDLSTAAYLYRPLTDDKKKRADKGWFAVNFDLGKSTEIAKVTMCFDKSGRALSGYQIGPISSLDDQSPTTVKAQKTCLEVNEIKTEKVNIKGSEAERRFVNEIINTETDKLQIKFDDYESLLKTQKEEEQAVKDSGDYTWGGNNVTVYEFELYTYSHVDDVDLPTEKYTSDVYKFEAKDGDSEQSKLYTKVKVKVRESDGNEKESEPYILPTEITLSGGGAVYINITDVPSDVTVTSITID